VFADELGVEGYVPPWIREYGALGQAFWMDTLVSADSGRVNIERVSSQELVGSYALSGIAGARLGKPGRAVHFAGSFVAVRDLRFERYVYRKASEIDMRPIRDRCHRAPPT
jgi:hypothetical protein